ncbi:MAG: serine kinase [Pseudomonadota bacterium]|nr:serine kinase [Pseudomonadota bacterium]
MTPAPPRQSQNTLHATSVAIDGRAALITGPSGSGKSGLALDLIALGAVLISDDMTCVELDEGNWPIARTTGRMCGVIEARGLGLIKVPYLPAAPISLIVDLSRTETARLPDPRTTDLLGAQVLTVSKVDTPHFAASILALMKAGLAE